MKPEVRSPARRGDVRGSASQRRSAAAGARGRRRFGARSDHACAKHIRYGNKADALATASTETDDDDDDDDDDERTTTNDNDDAMTLPGSEGLR